MIFIGKRVVPFQDPNFKYSRLGTRWQGQLYTGLSYQFHGNYQPYKIQFFFNGQQVGTEHRWYSNGIKWLEVQYKNGKRHGASKSWYRDGKVQSFRNYFMGLAHGEFWGWHSNGEVSDFHIFNRGRQLIYKSFVSDGKPFYNYIFNGDKTVGLKAGEFCKTKKL